MYLVSSRGERHLGLSHQNIAILGWVLRVVVLLSNRGHVFYSEKRMKGTSTLCSLTRVKRSVLFFFFFEGIISIVLVFALEAQINMMGLAQNKFICSPPE